MAHHPIVEKFLHGLERVEQARELEPMVGLFSDHARLYNAPRHVERRGRDGAHRFWQEYRQAFGEIRSEFTNILEGDNTAALEWRSAGRLPDGRDLFYSGVSVLRFDGDRITEFRTYYDSAVFLAGHAGTAPSRHEGDAASNTPDAPKTDAAVRRAVGYK